MAQITNGAVVGQQNAPPPNQQPSKQHGKPSRSPNKDKKKDLYNHVAMDKLYAYNPVISHIMELSKKPIAHYVNAAARHWQDAINKLGFYGVSRFPTKDAIFTMDIDEDDRRESDSSDSPASIASSVIEVADPYDVLFDAASTEEICTKIKKYIDLGLYPLITEAMTEADFYQAFEKYDSVAAEREVIGTIVDVGWYPDKDQPEWNHVLFTIVWDPVYVYAMNTSSEFYASKMGYCVLRDMIKTPDVWKVDDRSEDFYLNFGVPMYEFNVLGKELSILRNIDGFIDAVNEAVVTGVLPLDFVSHLLANLHETTEKLSTVVQHCDTNETHEPLSGVLHSTKHKMPEEQYEDDVIVQDAAETNELARRLHLYDEPSTDTDDDDYEDPIFY